MFRAVPVLILAAMLWLSPIAHAGNDAVVKAMEGYLDFVDSMGGTILPRQIAHADWKDIYVIDTRDAEQYQKERIPGAVHIE